MGVRTTMKPKICPTRSLYLSLTLFLCFGSSPTGACFSNHHSEILQVFNESKELNIFSSIVTKDLWGISSSDYKDRKRRRRRRMHSALVKPAYAQNIKQANELVFGNWEYPVATFFAHRSPSLYVNFYSPMKHHSLSLVIGGRPRNCSAPLSLIFLSFFPFLYILHDDDNDAKHKSLIYSDLQWVWSLPSSLPKVHLSPDDQLQS